MVERSPHVLVVSSIVPTGVGSCTNVVEFHYPEGLCVRMQRGRHASHQQGINETEPYPSPREDGMMHVHAFLRRQLEPHLV